VREGKVLAHNILAEIRGTAKKPFKFRTLGQLVSIGRRTGVAQILGFKFSGFLAWFLQRGIYWSKLPRVEKKVRVAIDWLLDLLFTKDFTQFVLQRAPVISMLATAMNSSSIAARTVREVHPRRS
jgi:NADH dehydrogenase